MSNVGHGAEMIARASEFYQQRFGDKPAACAFAPGRVNLMGEHTDYNGGYVLPMPLNLGTAVAIGEAEEPGVLHISSDVFDQAVQRNIHGQAIDHWSDYVLGAFQAVAADRVAKSGVRIAVAANLPVGSGLSSSAAIEVASLRAAQALFGTECDPVEIAKIARKVENDFVGLPSGIMDQFSVSVGTKDQALFLDTRTLKHVPVPLPDGYRILVIHSGIGHKLTDNGYAARVAECAAAAKALGVSILSDVQMADMDRVNELIEPLAARVRHIVTENERTKSGLCALRDGDARTFGRLMDESHISQRDDYAVSVPQIDELVSGMKRAGAVGARLTGGGFGGSIVALVEVDKVDAIKDALAASYPKARLLACM